MPVRALLLRSRDSQLFFNSRRHSLVLCPSEIVWVAGRGITLPPRLCQQKKLFFALELLHSAHFSRYYLLLLYVHVLSALLQLSRLQKITQYLYFMNTGLLSYNSFSNKFSIFKWTLIMYLISKICFSTITWF